MTQQPPKVEGQGLAGPSNPLRASEESTEQKLARWRKLRDHLHNKGLNEAPPDALLLEPEPTTRPDVRLVAYYDEVMQKSPGASRLAGVGTLAGLGLINNVPVEELSRLVNVVVQLFFGPLPWLPPFIEIVLVGLALLLAGIFANMARRVFKHLVAREDRLCLTLKELSLSLPDGRRHARWTDGYAVSVEQEIKWFSRQWPWVGRKEPCVRVELDDGMVAWLYPDAAECQLLADLMTDFLLCARNGGRPLRERAAAPEQLDRPA